MADLPRESQPGIILGMKDDLVDFVLYKGVKIDRGFPVRILSTPGKRDGFLSAVVAIRLMDGKPHSVDVRDPHSGGLRTFRLSRVKPQLPKESRRNKKKKPGG